METRKIILLISDVVVRVAIVEIVGIVFDALDVFLAKIELFGRGEGLKRHDC